MTHQRDPLDINLDRLRKAIRVPGQRPERASPQEVQSVARPALNSRFLFWRNLS